MNEDQAKGKAKRLEGQGQESWGDAKEKADETWEEAKGKLDDLGDNFGDIKDKLAKDKLDDLGDNFGDIKDKLAKDKLGHDDESDEVFEEADREREPRVGRPA